MFGFGQKRTRVSRTAAIRRPETFATRILKLLQDRDVLLRLGISLIAIILLIIALQSWHAPFPYRRGDFVPHGIAARIEFHRVDEGQTRLERDRAAQDVPWIFWNNSTPLKLLPEEFRAALGEIAAAQNLNQVSRVTRQNFGLINLQRSDYEDDAEPENELVAQFVSDWYELFQPEERFQKLKSQIVGPDMMRAEQRITEMTEEFREFIAPIVETGIIPTKILSNEREELTPDKRLLIVNEGDQIADGRIVLLPVVRLQDQLTEAGNLGRSWDEFEVLKPDIRLPVMNWLIERIPTTLRYDRSATATAIQKARDEVEERLDVYLPGDLLVDPERRLGESELELLQDEYDAEEATIRPQDRFSRVLIAFFMISVLAVLNGFYIVKNEPRISRRLACLITFWATIVLTAFVGRIASFGLPRAEIIPLLFSIMLLSIAFNQILATLTAFSLTLLLTMATTGHFSQFLVLMSTATAAIIPLKSVSTRSTLIITSLIAATTFFVVSNGIAVIESQSITDALGDSSIVVMNIKGAAMCLVAGFFVAGLLPFIEKAFGVVTDMTLFELSDPSHPLLQDLVRLAPGTYNHSIAVASIAETAAERIGSNGLLARVGAYFHDIGKMLKPHYFIENMEAGVANRHELLNPAMSTLIIIGHVKDGAVLGEQYGLPQPLIDFILQHHGTTLVEYFYREASKIAETKPDHKTDAQESSFRYPGPKPQTPEAGVLMISDACESACRTLTEPTPKRIETLVGDIVMRRLLDGQFDECDLKMTDINTIKESVTKSLIGIYHGRIRYPDAAN